MKCKNMLKNLFNIILLCLAFTLNLNAGLVNSIAITVNEYPITLIDIDEKMTELKISKNEAISILIDEALYLQSIEKYNIFVDNFDVESYVEKLAKNNKMTMFEFKNAVSQQEDYAKFSEKIKLQLRHQKLTSAITANKLIMANDEDLKIYYNNHLEDFKIAKKIDAIQYSSDDQNLLKSIKDNPMMSNPNIKVKNKTFLINDVSDQMRYIVSKTPEKSFSTIFAENETYNILFISNKKDVETLPLETVKETILNTIMIQRENDYLKSYFESLKLSANIKIISQ